MKQKLLYFFSLLLLSATTFAQTVSPEYQDGKIWFKLKTTYNYSNTSMKEKTSDLPFATLPFIKKIENPDLQKGVYLGKNS